MGGPHTVGIVGLGVISGQYLDTLRTVADVRIVAVADLDRDRARAVADTIDGCRVLTTDDLVAADDVETVLNLTIPPRTPTSRSRRSRTAPR